MSKKTILYLLIISLICVLGLCNIITVNRGVLAKDIVKSSTSNIYVSLESGNNVNIKNNESTTIKYRITPNEYNTSVDEAVFLVDVSTKMKNPKNGGTRDRIKFAEDIIRNTKTLVDKSNNKIKLKAAVMGYSDQIYTFWSNNIEDKENTDLNKVTMYDINTDEGYRMQDRGSEIANTIMKLNSSSRNIAPALEKADELLQGNDVDITKNKNKAIIIITCGSNSIDFSDDKIKNIVDKGYKIITIDISNQSTKEENTSDEIYLKNMIEKLSKDGKYSYLKLESNGNNDLSDEQKKILSMSNSIYLKVLPVDMNNNNEYNYSQNKVYIPAMNGAIYGTTSASNSDYKVDDAKLTFDLAGNFASGDKALVQYNGQKEYVDIKDIGNNKIEIDISKFIKYEKDEKVFKPTIEKFTVSFDVTVTKDGGSFGKDQDGNDISNLTYKENISGKEIVNTVALDTPIINVRYLDANLGITLEEPSPKTLPNDSIKNVNINDTIHVKYNINVTPSYEQIMNIKPQPIDEVMFLVDLSNNMFKQQRQTYAINGLCNQIIGGILPTNKAIKMGVIGMGSTPELLRGDSNTEIDWNLNLDYTNTNLLNRNKGKEKNELEGRMKKLSPINGVEKPDVMNSLSKADEILQSEGKENNTKAIVLIVSQDFNYDESVISKLKDRGYKTIIMDISYDQDSNKNLAQQNLNKLYTELNGYGENYMNGQYQTSGNDRNYNFADMDCEKIAKSLIVGIGDKPYKFTNLQLNFDLGKGFSLDNNKSVLVNSEQGCFELKSNNTDENKYYLEIPEVDFQAKIIENPSSDYSDKIKVSYTPTVKGKPLIDGKIPVEFNVIFKEYTADNPVVFGTKEKEQVNNYFSYDDIDGIERTIKPIDTPRVKKNNIDITHGVYLTDENKKPIIESPCHEIFSKGSVVTMAAQFNVISKSDCLLTLDQGLTLVGQIKVYKIEGDTLIDLNINSDNNSFTIPSDTIGNIIVIYSVKIPPETSKKEFINYISVNKGDGKEATINSGTELPDLF